MEAVCPPNRTKLFSRSLQCLCRMGSELIIESSNDGLLFRSLNSSQSAYSQFSFSAHAFFDGHFHHQQELQQSMNENNNNNNKLSYFRVGVNSRSVLSAFKSLSINDQITIILNYTDQQGKINNNINDDDFNNNNNNNRGGLFQLILFSSLSGLKRIHSFPFLEQTNILQADFNKSSSTSRFSIKSKLLQTLVNYFSSSLQEISIQCFSDGLVIKSVDEGDDNEENKRKRKNKEESSDYIQLDSKGVHTENKLPRNQCVYYSIQQDLLSYCLTFSSREFRSLLAFTEIDDLQLHFYCTQPGKPILISNIEEDINSNREIKDNVSEGGSTNTSTSSSSFPSSPQGWCADLIIATLQDENFLSQQFSQQQQSQSQQNNNNNNNNNNVDIIENSQQSSSSQQQSSHPPQQPPSVSASLLAALPSQFSSQSNPQSQSQPRPSQLPSSSQHNNNLSSNDNNLDSTATDTEFDGNNGFDGRGGMGSEDQRVVTPNVYSSDHYSITP